MKRLLYSAGALLIVIAVTLTGGCSDEYADLEDGLYAELETSKGSILLRLAYEESPATVTNFVGLAEGNLDTDVREGEPFYDGLVFHRVVEDFVIQTGDPRGDGSGGPGYEFPNEISDSLRHDEAGVVSMANSGPHTNGSQFFITRGPTPWLDGQYSVFAHVMEGQDVVDEIEEGDTLEEVTVIRRGPDAREFEADQETFDRRIEALREELSEKQQVSIAEQLDYIERNWPEARETEKGLRYVVEQEGTGTRPQEGDEVAVEYTGYLLNGMPFESTENRDEPVTFTVGTGEVIEGWDRTLLDMSVGERRTVIVPPELAYGSDGARGIIPPNSFLVFEVELTDVRAGE